MGNYEPQAFINALRTKMPEGNVPICPYCHGSSFNSLDKFATILIGNDIGSVSIGPSVPSGMLVCENCGHIEFFALGALGLMNAGAGGEQ